MLPTYQIDGVTARMSEYSDYESLSHSARGESQHRDIIGKLLRNGLIQGVTIEAGNPIALFAIIPVVGKTVEIAGMVSDDVKPHKEAFTHLSILMLKELLARYDRVQAWVDSTDQRAVKWIERVGFAKEGIARKFTDGKDFFIYGAVNG